MTTLKELRRFIIEVSVEDSIPEPFDAADELLEALTNATLPAWVFSVDGVDPEPKTTRLRSLLQADQPSGEEPKDG